MTTEATQKRSATAPCEGVITKARRRSTRKSSIPKPNPSVDGPTHIDHECDGDRHQAGVPSSSQNADISSPVATSMSVTQSVHEPMLTFQLSDPETGQALTTDESCHVEQGRSESYYNWWRDQAQQNNLSILSVRLIGDCAAPDIYTLIPMHDLAFCSKWGQNRVLEHGSRSSPLELVLPVLTSPEIVEKAVAGVLSGQVKLSMLTVEPCLVLANSIGIEPLEMACTDYLQSKLDDRTADEVFGIALLADHLGLPALLEDAARSIAALPWWDGACGVMPKLAILLKMAPYKQDANKRRALLHNPQRGAYTELQVLELLDSMGCHEDEILFALRMEGLQSAELNALLAAIVSRPTDSYQLLRAAVQMHLTHGAVQAPLAWDSGVTIMGDLNLLSLRAHDIEVLPLGVKVHIGYQVTEGRKVWGVHVKPVSSTNKLHNLVDGFTIFLVHESPPYIRMCQDKDRIDCKRNPKGFSWSTYLSDARKLYAKDYRGSLTLGIAWEPIASSRYV